MPKTALDYDRDFSEDGLRQAVHQRVGVEPGRTPKWLNGDKARLVFIAMQWDRENLDDANKMYAKDVASFGRQAMASKEQSNKMGSSVPAPSQPQLNFTALQVPSDNARPSSRLRPAQTGNNSAAPLADPSNSLPDSIKEEYSAKLALIALATSYLEALKAELIGIQTRAESINQAEFVAWTQEHGLQRLDVRQTAPDNPAGRRGAWRL